MKLPALCAAMLSFIGIFFVTLFIAAASLVVPPSGSARPPFDADSNLAFGRNFGQLLARPDVALKIVKSEGRVSFEWTSRSEVHLHEVLEFGQHLYDIKRRQEFSAPSETAMR